MAHDIQNMSETKQSELLQLLWEYMRKDREHPGRVHTGYGTKTKEGLLRSINTIMTEDDKGYVHLKRA